MPNGTTRSPLLWADWKGASKVGDAGLLKQRLRPSPADERAGRHEMDQCTMSNGSQDNTASSTSADELVTVCAWSQTVRHDGEWISFERYMQRRFGLLVTHGIAPNAAAQLVAQAESVAVPASASAVGTVNDPTRLAALRQTQLLDSPATPGFDRITRLGVASLNVPATFISLVDDHRDFYLSHCGFEEPLASERQLTGQTFCHFTVQGEIPLVIPDTRADPVYAKVRSVDALRVAAYLGVPLVLRSGEVIGAFCAIDYTPRAWTESQVLAATDLASLVMSEIELRQAIRAFIAS